MTARHARPYRVSRPTIVVVIAAMIVALAGLVTPTLAGSSSRPGYGVLQATTSPELDAVISVDGIPRNTKAISGLELEEGQHEVCFGDVAGYIPPTCESTTIVSGAAASVVGTYVRGGELQVAVSPPDLQALVTVDGIARDRGPTSLLLAAGTYEVCGEQLPTYTSPSCQLAEVVPGESTLVELTYGTGDVEPAPNEPVPDPSEDPAGPTPPVGENLLTAAQQGMETSSSAWTPQGNTIVATTTSPVAEGDRSLRITTDTSGPYQDTTRTARAGTAQGTRAIPIEAGTTYDGFLRFRTTQEVPVRCEVRFFDGGGKILTTSSDALTTAAVDDWTALPCRGTAPSQAAFAALRVYVEQADFGDTFHAADPYLVAAGSDGPTQESPPAPEPEPVPVPEPDPTDDATQNEPEPPTAAPSSWQDAWATRDYATIQSWYRANTGIAAAGLTDADLRPSGSVTTSSVGQVIDGLLVNGTITIRHDGVTVRNTKVVNDGSSIAINVPWDARESVHTFRVENVSLIGTGGATKYEHGLGATYAAVHASRVYISGHGNGFRLSHTGADTVDLSMVENIRIHAGSHNTGMSFRGGSGKRVTRNWIEGSTSSALSLYPDVSAVHDFTASQNLFDGGTYSVHGGDDKTYGRQSTYLRFVDNLFTRSHQYGPLTAFDRSITGREWSGNQYLDGAPAG